jgi:hypothetical protein
MFPATHEAIPQAEQKPGETLFANPDAAPDAERSRHDDDCVVERLGKERVRAVPADREQRVQRIAQEQQPADCEDEGHADPFGAARERERPTVTPRHAETGGPEGSYNQTHIHIVIALPRRAITRSG